MTVDIPLQNTEFAGRRSDIIALVREKVEYAYPDVDMPEADQEIRNVFVRGSMFIVTWEPLDDFDCGEAGIDIFFLDAPEKEFSNYLLDLKIDVARYDENGELSSNHDHDYIIDYD